MIVDADSHFLEPLTVYRDHIDPGMREWAIGGERDERGWPWLTYRGRRLHRVDQHVPGRVDAIGEQRRRWEAGEKAPPASPLADACDPAERLRTLDAHGVDAALVFPNLGLAWEDDLRDGVPALCANLGAYNRWLREWVGDAGGRLFPVAQLSLRDLDWFDAELERCARAGIRLAMIGAHPVDGRALAHADFDRVWAACQDRGVAVCFHVSNVPLPLDPAWYALDPAATNKLLDITFLYLAPAVAVTSLIVHGKLEQFPGLRLGIVELSAGWVPGYLMHLDGAFAFYRTQNGRPLSELPLRPSEYFRRQVRVNAFPLEGASALMPRVGEQVFMWGSDYPHAEGMPVPSWAAYERVQPRPLSESERRALSGGNAEFLLGLRDYAGG